MADYSHEIADAVLGHLNDRGWKYRFYEQDGIIRYSMNLSGRIRSAEGYLRIRQNTFSGYMICPLHADPTNNRMITDMAEFLHRANFNMIQGNFELDFEDGQIRYKNTIHCGGVLPTRQMVDDAVDIPSTMLTRFSEGIVRILFGLSTPGEALDCCNGRK